MTCDSQSYPVDILLSCRAAVAMFSKMASGMGRWAVVPGFKTSHLCDIIYENETGYPQTPNSHSPVVTAGVFRNVFLINVFK